MGLFKKKEVKDEAGEMPELPQLPELPKLPDLKTITPEEKIQKVPPKKPSGLPKLPALPPTSPPKSFSDLPEIGPFDSPRAREIDELPPLPGPKSRKAPPIRERKTYELPEIEQPEYEEPSLEPPPIPTKATSQKSTESIYIKIDKFNHAVDSFKEIQIKVSEIAALLAKIREVKKREEEDLREWEREVENAKARLDAIDRNIFSKLG